MPRIASLPVPLELRPRLLQNPRLASFIHIVLVFLPPLLEFGILGLSRTGFRLLGFRLLRKSCLSILSHILFDTPPIPIEFVAEWSISRGYEEVPEVAATALAEAVGVVCWGGVRDTDRGADVGIAEFVRLCIVSI